MGIHNNNINKVQDTLGIHQCVVVATQVEVVGMGIQVVVLGEG